MIVLISGWAGVSASLYPLELGLRWRLSREVIRADVGFGFGCIRASAELVASQLARHARDETERIDVVGYSMGGLVATYLLKAIDAGDRVRSVITLGTPHRGAPAMRATRALLTPWSQSLAQMVPGCDFLEELAAAEVPEGSRIVSISSHADSLVPPPWAELPYGPGHSNRVLSGVGHLGLLVSVDALDAVESLLAEPATRATRRWRRAPRFPSRRAQAMDAR